MKDTALKIINDLKKYDSLYIIGHNNIDADSFFSSYLLYKVLRSFDINAFFSILDDFHMSEEEKEMINDFKIEDPIIVKRREAKNKTFILVDHNDPMQSLGSEKYNIVLSIDHHLERGLVKNTYSIEYTSTGLFIYDLFKSVYDFSNLKDLVALTVMADSCYLTTSRYKESDKVLFNELNTSLDVIKMRDKYFKTMDFSLDMDYNIKISHKVYHIEDIDINRVIVKCYNKDIKYIDDYVKRSNELYTNNIFILNNFDEMKTYVYFKGNLIKVYDLIITSSMLITKKLIDEIRELL
jgi:inorganic pyrophosphatase/exopolyphosphatase